MRDIERYSELVLFGKFETVIKGTCHNTSFKLIFFLSEIFHFPSWNDFSVLWLHQNHYIVLNEQHWKHIDLLFLEEKKEKEKQTHNNCSISNNSNSWSCNIFKNFSV